MVLGLICHFWLYISSLRGWLVDLWDYAVQFDFKNF